MKSIKSIFEYNKSLLEEPEVQELIDCYEELQSELIDIKQEAQFSKELIFSEMIREIRDGCDEILNSQEEIDYKEMVKNLKNYVLDKCDKYNIMF